MPLRENLLGRGTCARGGERDSATRIMSTGLLRPVNDRQRQTFFEAGRELCGRVPGLMLGRDRPVTSFVGMTAGL